MYIKVTHGNRKICPLYTGLNYIHYSLMGRVRLPFIVIRYIEISFKVGLTVYPPDLAITHVGSECDSLNVFRLLTDFVYLYTYEF